MFPTFVGIGVPRGGTTWLHELLARHPDIYVPTKRKEVAYFNAYYNRGTDWYERFFPAAEDANRYRAVGEVTPGYLYSQDAPRRMAAMPSLKHLLVILRHPVKRLYSQYVWLLRNTGYGGSFEQFLQAYPEKIQESYYVSHLNRYLAHFEREQIQILITEEATDDPQRAGQEVCRFLGVDPDGLPSTAGTQPVNASSVPRFRRAFALASRARVLLRWYDLDWAVTLANRCGLKRILLGNTTRRPAPMKAETWLRLQDEFADDVADLESMLGREVKAWREQHTLKPPAPSARSPRSPEPSYVK